MSALSIVYIIRLKQKAYLHANSISNIKLILEKTVFSIEYLLSMDCMERKYTTYLIKSIFIQTNKIEYPPLKEKEN